MSYIPEIIGSHFHWCQVYGLGIAWDTSGIDRYVPAPWATRRECDVKVFLGPLLITFSFPITKWKDMP